MKAVKFLLWYALKPNDMCILYHFSFDLQVKVEWSCVQHSLFFSELATFYLNGEFASATVFMSQLSIIFIKSLIMNRTAQKWVFCAILCYKIYDLFFGTETFFN
jgi:hypothetical protein